MDTVTTAGRANRNSDREAAGVRHSGRTAREVLRTARSCDVRVERNRSMVLFRGRTDRGRRWLLGNVIGAGVFADAAVLVQSGEAQGIIDRMLAAGLEVS